MLMMFSPLLLFQHLATNGLKLTALQKAKAVAWKSSDTNQPLRKVTGVVTLTRKSMTQESAQGCHTSANSLRLAA